VDGFSRASSTAAATNSSALFGIYRWGWGFSTSQDFNGDIALIACFACAPWDEVPALFGSAPPTTPPATGTGSPARWGSVEWPLVSASRRVIGPTACTPTWSGWSGAHADHDPRTSGSRLACARVNASWLRQRPRLLLSGSPAIENDDRIIIEDLGVNTLSCYLPERTAVRCWVSAGGATAG
jgi:hypothetical protein